MERGFWYTNRTSLLRHGESRKSLQIMSVKRCHCLKPYSIFYSRESITYSSMDGTLGYHQLVIHSSVSAHEAHIVQSKRVATMPNTHRTTNTYFWNFRTFLFIFSFPHFSSSSTFATHGGSLISGSPVHHSSGISTSKSPSSSGLKPFHAFRSRASS